MFWGKSTSSVSIPKKTWRNIRLISNIFMLRELLLSMFSKSENSHLKMRIIIKLGVLIKQHVVSKPPYIGNGGEARALLARMIIVTYFQFLLLFHAWCTNLT
eukprot:UN15565